VTGTRRRGGGEAPAGDGDPVFVTEQLLDQSLNVALVRDAFGHAELYATTPLDLIQHLRGLIGLARSERIGMGPSEDVTTSPARPRDDWSGPGRLDDQSC